MRFCCVLHRDGAEACAHGAVYAAGNPMGSVGAEHLANALKRVPQVQVLNLNGTTAQLGCGPCDSVSRNSLALPTPRTTDTALGAQGLAMLASQLTVLTALHTLCLEGQLPRLCERATHH